MASSPQTVFVCGITGTQGGAAAHHIFRKPGWVAHGLVRNPDTDAARALAAKGAKLFPAPDGYDDEAALAEAMAGCTAVFIAMMPDFADPEHEGRQVKSILTHAKAARARVVLSTGFSASSPWELENWDPEQLFAKFLASKNRLEGMVKEAGPQLDSWTILRPGFFMANFLPPNARMYPGIDKTRVWKTALRPDTKTGLIDDLDIGAFAVAAIDEPPRFNGHEIEIAAELLTPGEIASRISKVIGKEFRAEFYTDEEVEAQKDNPFIQGNIASRKISRFFDPVKANSYGIRFGTFEEYLERKKDDFKKFYA